MQKCCEPPKIQDFGLQSYDENHPRYLDFIRATKEWEHSKIMTELGFPDRHCFKEIDFLASPEAWRLAYEKIKAHLGKGLLCALLGDRGLGKTQLAVTVAKEVSKPRHGHAPVKIRYSTAVDLIREVRSTWKKSSKESEDQVVDRYRNAGFLIIDEFSEIKGDDMDKTLFTNLIDARYNSRRDTILIANLEPGDVPIALGPSITSRMNECGGIIELKGKSFRE